MAKEKQHQRQNKPSIFLPGSIVYCGARASGIQQKGQPAGWKIYLKYLDWLLLPDVNENQLGNHIKGRQRNGINTPRL